MSTKAGRQEAVKWVVRNKAVRTQRDLIEELAARGFSCTQATASRDIAELGLRKLPNEGIYVLAEDLHLQHMVTEFVKKAESVTNFTVLSTEVGTAPGVAAAIDEARLQDVMGTIAGNDTVLVICRSPEASSDVTTLLARLKSEGSRVR